MHARGTEPAVASRGAGGILNLDFFGYAAAAPLNASVEWETRCASLLRHLP
jgi:hypothetical protein